VIAARGAIVLTGGTHAGEDAVKNSAIAGAGSSPWIGVERSKTISSSIFDSGFVINSDLDHKRNYLEACLCDAAIGLKGGDGTLSEVTFSLSLGRPVAFVGDDWKEQCCLEGTNSLQVLSSMVNRSFNRVLRTLSGKPSLDKILNEQVIREGLNHLPAYKYFSFKNNPEDILEWILQELSGRTLEGRFPAIQGYDSVANAYENWLCEHGM
jgi:SLOG cluster4 family